MTEKPDWFEMLPPGTELVRCDAGWVVAEDYWPRTTEWQRPEQAIAEYLLNLREPEDDYRPRCRLVNGEVYIPKPMTLAEQNEMVASFSDKVFEAAKRSQGRLRLID